MNTKNQILEQSIKLFSKQGLENVSTYDIANKIGISQGNLTYHFPTKKELINALAKKMICEIDSYVMDVDVDFSFKEFYDNLRFTFGINLKYPFIYMNYSQIVLNDKDLNDYFIQNSAGRKVLLRKMLNILVINGYITNNGIIKINDQIADVINLIAVYWVPESEIYHKGKGKNEIINHHLGLIFLLFKPYLTKKGEKNLNELVQY